MKKKSLWRAKLMARMAQDGDVEGLAEIISEMMEDPSSGPAMPAAAIPAAIPASVPAAVRFPGAAVIPAAAPALNAAMQAADPVAAVVAAVEENLNPAPAEAAPVVVETPVEQPVIVDCGPQILEALQRIIALMSGSREAGTVSPDCNAAPAQQDACGGSDPDDPACDGDPSSVDEAVAKTAAEMLAENVAAAAVEAVAETVEPELMADGELAETEDPVEALVAEILESGEGAEEPASGDEILSAVLEPEEAEDEDGEDPEDTDRAADALRSALTVFRPVLKRMSPKERRRFNADVAARMKKLTRNQPAGKPGAYAAIRRASAHDGNGRDLGKRIMASRNVNMAGSR